MLNIIVSGCNGQMGRVLTDMIAETSNIKIAAGIDISENPVAPYPVYESLAACSESADVVIDFSTAAAVDDLLAACVAKQLPLVLCSTGLSSEQLAAVEEASAQIPILRSANMSLGINLLMKLVQEATRTLAAADFDIEIVEKHHRKKLDAPSGTALSLAESINKALASPRRLTFDRSAEKKQRDPEEIGISAVRGGSIVGEHEVLFAGQDEVVTISHSACSRSIFAKGALTAARFLVTQPAGLYTMADVIA